MTFGAPTALWQAGRVLYSHAALPVFGHVMYEV